MQHLRKLVGSHSVSHTFKEFVTLPGLAELCDRCVLLFIGSFCEQDISNVLADINQT